MKRLIASDISKSAKNKIILITGPRQSGKTTLSKSLSADHEYLNYDRKPDRLKIIKETWDQSKEFLIFDEIHKLKKWKLWLKGIFDTVKNQKILVTGSARLDMHKKVGDSLAGRYFQYHLFPFDLKELHFNSYGNTKSNFDTLMTYSGFPEPFLNATKSFYNKWRRSHLDVIIKHDIIELETIKRLGDLETLLELIYERVGSSLSYNSLREDLNTDEKSVKRWLTTFENAFVLFKITPYYRSIKDSIKKSPKYYLFDFPRIQNEGAKLENFVALSLWKEIHFRNDVNGDNYSLHYLKNKRQQEIDFLICNNKMPLLMIEVKQSDDVASKNFNYFENILVKQNPNLKKIQLVSNLNKDFITRDKVEIKNLAQWLEKMPFDL